jgi:hypothetical protein
MANEGGDRLAATLDRVADTVDEAAGEQRRAGRIAREAARGRRVDGIDEPSTTRAVRQVLELVGRSADHLTSAAGGLRRAWAAALAEQGLSIRQIGDRLGVTHQRVSALLTRHRDADASSGRR